MSSTPSPNPTDSHSSSLPTQFCLAQLESGSCTDKGSVYQVSHRYKNRLFSQQVSNVSISAASVGSSDPPCSLLLEILGLGLELAQVLCGLSQFLWVRIYYFRLGFEYSVVLILSATSASSNLPTLSAL